MVGSFSGYHFEADFDPNPFGIIVSLIVSFNFRGCSLFHVRDEPSNCSSSSAVGVLNHALARSYLFLSGKGTDFPPYLILIHLHVIIVKKIIEEWLFLHSKFSKLPSGYSIMHKISGVRHSPRTNTSPYDHRSAWLSGNEYFPGAGALTAPTVMQQRMDIPLRK